ncbi:MAG: hypothetical protein DYH08_13345, partial [Actinobacteria bacterium ATB1]|nr:hypothetical protein [Actinobacteria bacterium ATB1]
MRSLRLPRQGLRRLAQALWRGVQAHRPLVQGLGRHVRPPCIWDSCPRTADQRPRPGRSSPWLTHS